MLNYSQDLLFFKALWNITVPTCISPASKHAITGYLSVHFQLLKCKSISKFAFIKAKCFSLFTITESSSLTDCVGNNIFLCITLMFSSPSASVGFLKELVDQLID